MSPRTATDGIAAPQVFYTVTGEIALARREPRVAALQYTAAATGGTDLALLSRASEVTAETLQPSLTAAVAARWISLDPGSVDAHRAAAHAALTMQRIPQSAGEYRIVLTTSPRGADAEFADLETELASAGNVFGARQVADRLAASFPESAAALRLQGFAAMRADDPAAAVRSFTAALNLTTGPPDDARREITMGLWRARILSGDSGGPLAESQALAERETTPANLLDYALLLLAAQQNEAAIAELDSLVSQADIAPVALRLLGLVEFQENKLDAAARRFTELLATGKFLDDSFYYLGLIAERRGDLERALRLYAQVQRRRQLGRRAACGRATFFRRTARLPRRRSCSTICSRTSRSAPPRYSRRGRGSMPTRAMPQQAIEVLGRGIAQYPDSVDIRYAIATTYEEQGRVKAGLARTQRRAQGAPRRSRGDERLRLYAR